MTTQVHVQPESIRQPVVPGASDTIGLSATRMALRLLGRVSPEKAGRLVNHMAFRPSRLPMPSRYEYLLDSVDGYTQLQHGAYIIPVYSWGNGPVILGVHGWSGAGIQFGAWITPLVDAGYRVVLFDAPAHGRAQGERTDLFDMAEVVAKVAASVGEIYGILSHSMGSLAAARAIADGLQARYLLMLAPPVSLRSVMDHLGRQLGLSAEVLAVHLRLMEEQFGPSVWDKLDMESLSRTLTQRGLVVLDQDDSSIEPTQSERVHSGWVRGDILRTRGLGHHRILHSPLVLDKVLQDLGRTELH